ncbi:hypothetical protein MMC07_009264 [Pseudocyphellaria aurata]|nr:hypothetical protein [Pseudocyphellaria aurata]
MLFVPKKIESASCRYFDFVLGLTFLASLLHIARAAGVPSWVPSLLPSPWAPCDQFFLESLKPPPPAESDYPSDRDILYAYKFPEGQILLMAMPQKYLPQYKRFCQAGDVVCVDDAFRKDFLFPSSPRSTAWALHFYVRLNASFMDRAYGTVLIATEDAQSPYKCKYFTCMIYHLQRNKDVKRVVTVDVNDWNHQMLVYDLSPDALLPDAGEQVGLNEGNIDGEYGIGVPSSLVGMGLPVPESDKISVPDLGFQMGEAFKTDEQPDFPGFLQRRQRDISRPDPKDCFTWLNPSILAELGQLSKTITIADLTATSVGATFRPGSFKLGATAQTVRPGLAVGADSAITLTPPGPVEGAGNTGESIGQGSDSTRTTLSADSDLVAGKPIDQSRSSAVGTSSTGNTISSNPDLETGNTEGRIQSPGSAVSGGSNGNMRSPGPAPATGDTGGRIQSPDSGKYGNMRLGLGVGTGNPGQPIDQSPGSTVGPGNNGDIRSSGPAPATGNTEGRIQSPDSAGRTGNYGSMRLDLGVGTGNPGQPIAQSPGSAVRAGSNGNMTPDPVLGTGNPGGRIAQNPGSPVRAGSNGNMRPDPVLGTGNPGKPIAQSPGSPARAGSNGNMGSPDPVSGTGNPGGRIAESPNGSSDDERIKLNINQNIKSSGEHQETFTLVVIQRDVTETSPRFILDISLTDNQNLCLVCEKGLVAAPGQEIPTTLTLVRGTLNLETTYKYSYVYFTVGSDQDATLTIRYESPFLGSDSDLTQPFLSSNKNKCSVTPWAESQRQIQCSFDMVYD